MEFTRKIEVSGRFKVEEVECEKGSFWYVQGRRIARYPCVGDDVEQFEEKAMEVAVGRISVDAEEGGREGRVIRSVKACWCCLTEVTIAGSVVGTKVFNEMFHFVCKAVSECNQV